MLHLELCHEGLGFRDGRLWGWGFLLVAECSEFLDSWVSEEGRSPLDLP